MSVGRRVRLVGRGVEAALVDATTGVQAKIAACCIASTSDGGGPLQNANLPTLSAEPITTPNAPVLLQAQCDYQVQGHRAPMGAI